ncbi:hypothetical protein COO91_08128 [Nostoc flagelliforme CCNUN1]|uniref:Uncharacterized protein n=1 Tax=Nostoc flagelliforme CCNUN1 TaxID=2038116 RepID=A0A2K8T2Z8_9NOSO|nr:hypothetical protein COO91_08128 [Nostoc flagelliforme CCNUN1]
MINKQYFSHKALSIQFFDPQPAATLLKRGWRAENNPPF